jgi:hypothetical protein
MVVNQNIFIEHSIIQNSNPKKLREEMELLIALKNKIFVWSKTVSPIQMKINCLAIKFEDIKESELHKTVCKMKLDKKSYKEITESTGVPMWKIGFYLTTDPNKIWTLNDWIKDYYKKDSAIYSKVDFIIDSDKKLIDRFKSAGIDGNLIEKII